jgi:hypothetical protein
MIKKEQLEKTELFGDLKAYVWDELLKITEERDFAEGEVIFTEGEKYRSESLRSLASLQSILLNSMMCLVNSPL